MSAAKTCLAGLVLFSLTAAACTSDDATEARGETLGADLAEAEIALAEVQADLAAAIETADELAENLAAVQAQLGEKEQLLASRTQELEAARDELAGARAEAADLSAVLWQLRASATLVCPLPSAGLPYQALPLAVAETRARIHAAAVNCNWLELHRLADEAGGIDYADGAVGWHGDPVPYWLASPGELQLLAGILEVPFGTYRTTDNDEQDITVYIWPAVTLDEHQSEADWVELLRVYSEEEIERIRTVEGYLGFAVTIRAHGTWRAALHVSV